MSDAPDFFDSNVIIAGSVSHHQHHEAALKRLASTANHVCAAHTLAEVYANLTRAGKGYNMPASDALLILERVKRTFTLVALTSQETFATLATAARAGLVGPKVYDALLLACARKAHARRIYTFNLGDFRQIAPDLASRIVEP